MFNAASSCNQLDATLSELENIQQLLKESDKLSTFLQDPCVEKSAKNKVLGNLLQKVNSSSMVRNFVNIIADNGRLALTSSIISTFQSIVKSRKNVVTFQITTGMVCSWCLSDRFWLIEAEWSGIAHAEKDSRIQMSCKKSNSGIWRSCRSWNSGWSCCAIFWSYHWSVCKIKTIRVGSRIVCKAYGWMIPQVIKQYLLTGNALLLKRHSLLPK